MKKLMSFLLSLFMLLSMITGNCLTASAAEATSQSVSGYYGDFEYEVINIYCVEITGYTGNEARISIPSYINGYEVTRIGTGAFAYSENLTMVNIPNSIESIDYYAFGGCKNLRSVSIPKSVTNIGGAIFGGCSALSQIIVDKDNPVYDSRNNCNAIIKTNENSLVTACMNTSIPKTVTSIGDSAYSGFETLTNIVIPDNITSLGDSAFYNCTGLADIKITSNVTNIGNYAFGLCSSLKSIILPKGVKQIGVGAFMDCHSLTNVTISDTVTDIGAGAFRKCKNLLNINIPETVSSIGDKAFGYALNSKYDNFKIYGVAGSVAEKYANDNDLVFCDICQNVLSISNNVSPTQVIYFNITDGFGIEGYYFGKNAAYSNNKYSLVKSGASETIFDEGTYYFALKYKSGKISDVIPITFNKTVFNCNGGSISPEYVISKQGNSFMLPNPTKDGCKFKGWATSPSTKGYCSPNSYYAVNCDSTLYAVWEKTYTITYNGNEGSGIPAAQIKQRGVDINLSDSVPYRSGYSFKGWATKLGGKAVYQPGANYKLDADAELYAVWDLICKRCGGTGTIENFKTCSYCDGTHYCCVYDDCTNCNDGYIKVSIWMKYDRYSVCPICLGGKSGAIDTSCFYCGGYGYLFYAQCSECDGKGTIPRKLYCTNCNSNGLEFYSETCSDCKGIGTTLDTYSISYDSNGGKGGPLTQSKKQGADINISCTVPVREEYVFKGWSINKDGNVLFSPGDLCDLDANIILYAVWSPQSTDRILGDVNGDGVINILDATNIQKLLAESDAFTEEQIKYADVNGDGCISVLDVTKIQKYLVGLVEIN